nr:WG repeat-containing protein [uncultured Catonella sp.]
MNKIKGFIKKISVFLIVAMVCGIIVPSGAKAAVELDYDYIGDAFSEGLMIVGKDKKYGYIDEAGKEIVEPKYDDVDEFKEGIARVKKDGKYSIIDKKGEIVFSLKYNNLSEED